VRRTLLTGGWIILGPRKAASLLALVSLPYLIFVPAPPAVVLATTLDRHGGGPATVPDRRDRPAGRAAGGTGHPVDPPSV